MGAQKKCQLLLFTTISSIFAIIILYSIILDIIETYTIKKRYKDKLYSWLSLLFYLSMMSMYFFVIIIALRQSIKFKLIYKKKNQKLIKLKMKQIT